MSAPTPPAPTPIPPIAPSSNNPSPPAPTLEKVPEELLIKLHDANQRFSEARHHREEAIDSSSPETTERDKAHQEMLDAERTVEEVTDEIDTSLHPPQQNT
jgi:hypothetical protein